MENPLELWKPLLEGAGETGQAIFQGVLTALGVDRVRRWLHQRETSSEEVPPELTDDAKAHWLVGQLEEAQREAQNLVAISDKVAEDIRDNPPNNIAPHSPDPETADRFTRWRQAAANVSDDQMQAWWTRLWLGQVVQPGTYSLFSLDLLRRMAPRDALLAERAASLRLGQGILTLPDDIRRLTNNLADPGLTLEERSVLIDLGILRSQVEIRQQWVPFSLEMDSLVRDLNCAG